MTVAVVVTAEAAYPPAAADHSKYYLVTYYLIDSSCGPTVNPSVVQSVYQVRLTWRHQDDGGEH